jgi:hypothetical protein
MPNHNGASGGSLLIQNWLSRTIAATKFWALPIYVGTKLVWILSLIDLVFFRGKPGYGVDYFRYYCHNFVIYLNEKFPNTCVTVLDFLDRQIRPEKLFEAAKDNNPEAVKELLWFAKTTHTVWLYTELFSGAMFVLAGAAWYVSRKVYEKQTADKWLRGSVLATPTQLNKMLHKELGKGSIVIGGGFLNWFWKRNITIPYVLEPQSYILLGRAGMGKTIVQNAIIKTILERGRGVNGDGSRGVVVCLKEGDFVSPFADLTTDKIYCPGDLRTLKWSFMTDVTELSTFDLIGYIFFPKNPKDTGPWVNGARIICIGLLKYAFVSGIKNTKRIYEEIFANPKGAKLWLELLLQTPECGEAAGLLALPESNTAFGFFITVLVGVQSLRVMAKNDGDFSIKKYMNDPTAGSIFILSRADFQDMLAPAQQLFITIVMINQLSMKQDLNRRFFWFLDELGNLPVLTKLDAVLAVCRSMGSSVGASCQSYTQLDNLYTEPVRRSMCNNMNVKYMFGLADAKTAEESSNTIGIAEYETSRQTISTNINDHGAVSTMSEVKKRELVLPSELTNLKMKEVYVTVPGYATAKIKVKYKKYPKVNEAFVPDPAYDIETIKTEYIELQKKAANYLASIAIEDAKLAADVAAVQNSGEVKLIVENTDELRWQQAITLISTDEDMGMF